MRHVDRSSRTAPEALTGAGSRGLNELAAIQRYQAHRTETDRPFRYAAYKDDGVKAALEALFHGKCAYCESVYQSQAPVDVEHYRPKGGVEGEPEHSGYWWLAMRWDNLLPSCIDCNRRRKQITPELSVSFVRLHEALHDSLPKKALSGKMDAFPIKGTRVSVENGRLESELPVIINPTVDDPNDHLTYHLDPVNPIGLVLPKTIARQQLWPCGTVVEGTIDGPSIRGAISIQVYGLNRLGLVQERTRLLRHLEFLRHVITEIDAVAQDVSKSQAEWAVRAAARLDLLIESIVKQIKSMAEPDQPYSAMVRQWIAHYRAELSTNGAKKQ